MGNQCCSQCQTSTAQSSSFDVLSNPIPNIAKQPSYIDNQGNPLPNAYKRYVKPPTTVGRQSVIVRKLQENEDVPDWIWATNNQNTFNSSVKKGANMVNPFNRPYADNRNTYELIEGRFKGMPTVNLSKIQNKNITGSHIANPQNPSNENTRNIIYSVPPTAFATKSGFDNSSMNKPTVNPVAQQPTSNSAMKRTYSISDIPVVTSINMDNGNNGGDVNMTQSKQSQMSPFQMITHGQNDRNQPFSASGFGGNNPVQIHSGFNSNIPSVNNSIQRSPRY